MIYFMASREINLKHLKPGRMRSGPFILTWHESQRHPPGASKAGPKKKLLSWDFLRYMRYLSFRIVKLTKTPSGLKDRPKIKNLTKNPRFRIVKLRCEITWRTSEK
jgi:hypothetical protein